MRVTLHLLFTLLTTYAVCIAWKMNGLFDMLPETNHTPAILKMLENAGPMIFVGAAILFLTHVFISRKKDHHYGLASFFRLFLLDLFVISVVSSLILAFS